MPIEIGARKTAWAMFLAVMLALMVGAGGCKNSNLYSTKDEIAMGKQASKQVDNQFPVDTTSPDAERVRRIGERLLPHTDQRAGMPYTFKVIDTKDINAVSLPGGPVYVFRGLLDLVGDDDDALATVIGHEIGHINARHVVKQISQQQEAGLLIGLLVRGYTTQNVAQLVSDLFTLRFSRDDEYEADRRGLSYAYKAGFDPRGMPRFFEKLQTLEKGGQDPEFLQTHPLTKDRIARAEKIIETQDYRYGQ